MVSSVWTFLLGAASLVAAHPVAGKRTVTELNQAAFEEAQQRDDTATRTSDGKCLFVDQLSGDFRANLTPVQIGECDGDAGMVWDVITAGKHNDQPGTMLIVNAFTGACLNFDPRRAAGNQVILFSCGGRADGGELLILHDDTAHINNHESCEGGAVTNSQLFPFAGSAGPLAFTPLNAPGTCLTVKGGVIDQAACIAGDPSQSFSFGDDVPPTSEPTSSTTVAAEESATTSVSATSAPQEPTTTSDAESSITLPPTTSTTAATTTASPSVVSVSRAGGVLNPSAAAEANPRDDTATRAFSSVSIRSASGQCLFIDRTAGDFRELLIPIVLQPCDGSVGQQWDFITSGKHNNQPNSALIVSDLTQGCFNFDPRRAAGDTVMIFSCGGRADGGGSVTDSQLFRFTGGETSLKLQPNNGAGSVCLAPNADGRLDQAACIDDPNQIFTIV
ncbi:uncharacterized protein A1O9_02678 [Exophiala aquamarina CBS 119918]|uniref:Ricin B lectin domain-containing protein n=1 Tax=Exophiala aquamarina CBS 119918 TaxID=1182545 RepID=A0A072PP38_9EURO|nr:uncharacterized protein A1O9_02678 [Exophiala aquamarina CBS 119918]KEF61113.1 hypothetical protein A1O9_02678 [Exophiala aquamarina CBS 119918]